MALATDRRSQRYGFESVEIMTRFFSKWIPETEIVEMVAKSETGFGFRKGSSEEETRLQRIQKAEFAIVRRLVQYNPSIIRSRSDPLALPTAYPPLGFPRFNAPVQGGFPLGMLPAGKGPP